jgi:hypothetical protein
MTTQSKYQVCFANDGDKAELTFSNELNLESDGWGQLFPFGDFPGKAVIANANGTVTSFDAVQRLDRAAADQMVSNFYSIGNRIKRFIKGVTIFNGHPDMPDAGSKYPDKGEKGLVTELQTRDNGLYCKPAFNNAGEEVLKGAKKLFFSGRWSSDELAEESGKRVFRPDSLKSVGLTSRPNLPVEQVNEKPQQIPNMKPIIEWLRKQGVTIANDANEEQIASALASLEPKLTSAATLANEKATLSNEKQTLTGTITARDNTITQLTSERDTARTNFANERKSRIAGLLDGAVTDGRITAAERPQWETRLGNEATFANEAEALGKLEKKMKTASITLQMGERKIDISNESQRQEVLGDLIAAEMKTAGVTYDQAYARVQKSSPALFAAMKQPTIQLPKR